MRPYGGYLIDNRVLQQRRAVRLWMAVEGRSKWRIAHHDDCWFKQQARRGVRAGLYRKTTTID